MKKQQAINNNNNNNNETSAGDAPTSADQASSEATQPSSTNNNNNNNNNEVQTQQAAQPPVPAESRSAGEQPAVPVVARAAASRRRQGDESDQDESLGRPRKRPALDRSTDISTPPPTPSTSPALAHEELGPRYQPDRLQQNQRVRPMELQVALKIPANRMAVVPYRPPSRALPMPAEVRIPREEAPPVVSAEDMFLRSPLEGSYYEYKLDGGLSNVNISELVRSSLRQPNIGDVQLLFELVNTFHNVQNTSELIGAMNRIAVLVSGVAGVAKMLIEMKILPRLKGFLVQTECEELREKSLVLFFYLAYYRGRQDCEKFLRTGVLFHLLACYQSRDDYILLDLVSHTLASLCLGNREVHDFIGLESLLYNLKDFLDRPEVDELKRSWEYCCLAIAYLSKGPPERMAQVMGSDIMKAVVELTSHKDDNLAWAAMLACKMVISYDGCWWASRIMGMGLLNHFRVVLETKPEPLHYHLIDTLRIWLQSEFDNNASKVDDIVKADLVPLFMDKLLKAPRMGEFEDFLSTNLVGVLRITDLMLACQADDIIQIMLDNKLLAKIKLLFTSCRPNYVIPLELATSIVAYISSGVREESQELINERIYPLLFEKAPLIESARAKASILTALELHVHLAFIEQIDYLVSVGALEFAVSLLSDEDLTKQALSLLDDFLLFEDAFLMIPERDRCMQPRTLGYAEVIEECGGVTEIEKLLNHEDEDIRGMAQCIYEENFIDDPSDGAYHMVPLGELDQDPRMDYP